MVQFKVGDIAYLIESRRYIREGKIIRMNGGLCMFRFIEGGGTQVHANRLYETEEAAQTALDHSRMRNPSQALALFI